MVKVTARKHKIYPSFREFNNIVNQRKMVKVTARKRFRWEICNQYILCIYGNFFFITKHIHHLEKEFNKIIVPCAFEFKPVVHESPNNDAGVMGSKLSVFGS